MADVEVLGVGAVGHSTADLVGPEPHHLPKHRPFLFVSLTVFIFSSPRQRHPEHCSSSPNYNQEI